jgi:hypothetical protein
MLYTFPGIGRIMPPPSSKNHPNLQRNIHVCHPHMAKGSLQGLEMGRLSWITYNRPNVITRVLYNRRQKSEFDIGKCYPAGFKEKEIMSL